MTAPAEAVKFVAGDETAAPDSSRRRFQRGLVKPGSIKRGT